MAKGKGWDRRKRQDELLLASMLKEVVVKKQKVMARFRELQALDPEMQKLIDESVLCEWDEKEESYRQVGQMKLGNLLSGKSRPGWSEPRLTQVLSDTLDYVNEGISQLQLRPAILQLDRQLSYMHAFRRFYTAYLYVVDPLAMVTKSLNWPSSIRLRLRQEAAEFGFYGARICYSYDLESLWCFLDNLQQLRHEQEDAALFRVMRTKSSAERGRKHQDQAKRAYLNELLGWQLPD